jgi:AraC-like DNA-binding protein
VGSSTATKSPALGMLRIAAIAGAVELVRTLGHDPAVALDVSGLSHDIFRDPENEIPFSAAARFLKRCAGLTGIAHFGLLAGMRNGVSTLGLVGHLAQSAADVETALHDIVGHFSVHDRTAQARLSVDGDEARLAYVLDRPRTPGAEHFYDGGIASTFNIVRDLCGPEWSAKLVTLPRRAPADRKPYNDFFNARIVFGSETASISFAHRWLRRPLPTANPSLRQFLQRLVRGAARRRGSQAEEIRRIIRLQLMGGKPGIDRAAAMIGATRRTLARRLAAEGWTFRALVQDVRFEMADELMKETDASMGRIAELLGYSDQTAFSRAFSNKFGHPPSRARGADS